MVSDGGMKFDDVMASDTTGMASDGVVSDPWFDDILTDGWNGVPRGTNTIIFSFSLGREVGLVSY